MCLAVPGKIVSIKDDTATVDYGEEKREGKILEGDFKEGDYVIIQGGFVMQKIPQKEAEASLKMYQEAIKNSEHQ
ncbi:HypC/HybG/HupF family hydrogenase formation chaperone [Candidatus Woesearchaeota archaeon]|nr:HypC/HybG/HupF family hydrogenase formation chaperone [Candidatus Woesearchaeota archaeon]